MVYTDSINILGLAVFALTLGIAISVAREKGRPLLAVFDGLFECIMIIVKKVMW